MHEKEKLLARTTNDEEKIFDLVTKTKLGMDVQIAALENQKTPIRVLEWLYDNARGFEVKTLIAEHPNVTDVLLWKILGNFIESSGESGTFRYPSWSAFTALLTLLKRKGILNMPLVSKSRPLIIPGAKHATISISNMRIH